MRSIYTESQQTVWDIAIQHMGSPEAIFDILKLNPGIRVDTIIPTDTEVVIPEAPLNQHVVDYYSQNLIVPATGINP